MSRNLTIALVVSLLLHFGVFFGGQLLKAHLASKPVSRAIPTLELMPIPPVESDKPEEMHKPGETSGIADIVPPMQADIPLIADSPFPRQIQPPPQPSIVRPTGVIFIPKGRLGGLGAGLGNIFDLANLDKNPEPIFRPLPIYPFDLRRAGIEGQVTVEFIVDYLGNVRDPRVVSSSNRGFDNAVLDGVLKWKFSPGKRGGVAVTTRRVEQTIPFRLN